MALTQKPFASRSDSVSAGGSAKGSSRFIFGSKRFRCVVLPDT